MDWKKKLTSRKFWMAIVGFITPLLLAFGVAETDVTQVTAIIMAALMAGGAVMGLTVTAILFIVALAMAVLSAILHFMTVKLMAKKKLPM